MNAAPQIDFARINAAAMSNPEGLVSRWLPNGSRKGNEWVCGSVGGEAGRSLSVNLSTGVWRDFADNVGGSDPVSLYAAIHGLQQVEAARKLASELGIDPGGNGSAPKPHGAAKPKPADDWRPIVPVPDDAPAPDFTHFLHGQPVAHWTYRDGQGQVVGYVCRFEPEQGRKEIIPLAYGQGPDGRRAWRFKSFPVPRPLYGLDRLAGAKPDAPVLLVEGEKTADAAARLLPETVCMTWPGGSKAVGKADFSSLKGRRVTIWPDADTPGRDAAKAVASRLKEAGAVEVSIITPPEGVAQGWDLADAEAEGWTTEQVKACIQASKEQAQSRAFRFLPLADLLSSPKPTKWLVRGYLDAGCLAALIGEPGSMKSFLAIDQGLCIASGMSWHGHAIPNPGPVFYLAGEGFGGISKRIKAWIVSHGADPSALPFFVSSAPAQLLDADHAREVADAVAVLAEQHGSPRLVIIDTLNRNFGPGDENDTRDMTAFVAALDTLKTRFGCAVLVVHHSGLQEKGRGRGSSVLKAALDSEYILSAKAGVRVLTCSKSKDHEPPAAMAFEPETVELPGWTDFETMEPMTSCVLRLTDMPDEERSAPSLSKASRIALEALQAICPPGGSASRDEWAEEACRRGITKSDKYKSQWVAFTRAKDNLLERGLVHFQDDQWSPKGAYLQTSTNIHFVDGDATTSYPQTSTRFFRNVDFVDVDARSECPSGREPENPFLETSHG